MLILNKQQPKLPALPNKVEANTIVDDENYVIGYYVKGWWNIASVQEAVTEDYGCDRGGYLHGFFRFVPSIDFEGMRIIAENKSKQGNFPVTYLWFE